MNDYRTGEAGTAFFRRRGLSNIFLPVIVVIILGFSASAFAEDTPAEDGGNLPRFASVNTSKLNVRQGPGTDYKVKFQYRRRGYPVKVVAEAQDSYQDGWSLIQDADGDEGWVTSKFLSDRRKLLVTGYGDTGAFVALRRDADRTSKMIAAMKPHVLLSLIKCEGAWCYGSVYPSEKKIEGWVHVSHVWGAYLERP